MDLDEYASRTWSQVPIEERQRRVLHRYRDRCRLRGFMPEPMSETAKTTYWASEMRYHTRLRRDWKRLHKD